MDVSRIDSLKLTNYRSFSAKSFSFDTDQILIIGNNGKGKTNILESISLLSTGRSFRGNTLSDCVRIGEDVCHVEAAGRIGDESIQIRASILAKDGNGNTRATSRYVKNGVAKRKSDVVGQLKSVVFKPEDLQLIESGSKKRDFLDDVLVQISGPYSHSLKEYELALRHRNKLILQLRDGECTRRDFYFWDQVLITHGDVITRHRAAFIHYMNEGVLFPIQGEVTYEHSLISEERLRQYAVAEVGAGKTLVGPHRDTLRIAMQITHGVEDVAKFGSRGQQRMAVLWLKVAQLQYIEKETKVTPILLLDDMFSELDETNRELIFSLFSNRQVLMTSAEELSMLPKECTQGAIIQL